MAFLYRLIFYVRFSSTIFYLRFSRLLQAVLNLTILWRSDWRTEMKRPIMLGDRASLTFSMYFRYIPYDNNILHGNSYFKLGYGGCYFQKFLLCSYQSRGYADCNCYSSSSAFFLFVTFCAFVRDGISNIIFESSRFEEVINTAMKPKKIFLL